VAFAKEGADVAIAYLSEQEDTSSINGLRGNNSYYSGEVLAPVGGETLPG
jgi:hypothetical protein